MCSKDGFFQKFVVSDKEFKDYKYAFLKKVDYYYANCTKNKNAKIQKMIEKYAKSLKNLLIDPIVYTLFYKK